MDEPIYTSEESGRRLRAARAATGLNQTQAAEKLGMRQGSYAPYELGKKTPGWMTLMRWVETLGLDPKILFPEFFPGP